jgi:hypothetical protein
MNTPELPYIKLPDNERRITSANNPLKRKHQEVKGCCLKGCILHSKLI